MSSLLSWIDRIPVSKDTVIGESLRFYLDRQDPELVKFEQRPNGYAIMVQTDEDNTAEALEFWEEHIEGKL